MAKGKGGTGVTKAGPGRPMGSKNKVPGIIKEAVLQALNEAHPDGAVGYLKLQAIEEPVAFMSLVGRIIPTQIGGDPDNPLKVIERIERVIIGAAEDDTSAERPTAH